MAYAKKLILECGMVDSSEHEGKVPEFVEKYGICCYDMCKNQPYYRVIVHDYFLAKKMIEECADPESSIQLIQAF